MSNAIILPLNISFDRWSDHLNEILPELFIPRSSGEESWWEWADQFISSNELWTVPIASKIVFPNPEDWRKWAIYFISLVNSP